MLIAAATRSSTRVIPASPSPTASRLRSAPHRSTSLNLRFAGVLSTVPAALTAMTLSTCLPRLSRFSRSGEQHPFQAWRSSLQRNLVPGWPVESVKRKTGRRARVFAAGAKVIRVCGAT